jgi:hypothetical protein
MPEAIPTSDEIDFRGLAGTALEAAEFDEAGRIRRELRLGGEQRLLRAVESARSLVARVAEHHRPRARLHAELLLVSSLEAAGLHDEASGTLLPLLQTGSGCGLGRLFVDEGPLLVRAVSRLRSEAANNRMDSAPIDFMQSILDEQQPLPIWPGTSHQ